MKSSPDRLWDALVLASVFRPYGVHSGITGRLYQHSP